MGNQKISKALAQSVINKLGREGVSYIYETGELPAVKLTSREMECLRGGNLMAMVKYLYDILSSKGSPII